jgi:hypothetical protein
VVIWYSFPRFGILDQEKSGNPGLAATFEGAFIYWRPRQKKRFVSGFQQRGPAAVSTLNQMLLVTPQLLFNLKLCMLT